MSKNKHFFLDGSEAVKKGVYPFLEIACIFPITPSTSLAYGLQDIAIFKQTKNYFGQIPFFHQYNSELGSIAGVHGALQNGVLGTTFTSSQGLLLMIPNIYKLCGQQLPAVIHLASRSIAKHALSINNDHADIYSLLNCGPIIIVSASHEEANRFAVLAHLIAIEASYPVVHAYDGNYIANDYKKVEILDAEFGKKNLNYAALTRFRNASLSPLQPQTRGGHQSSSTYFTGLEAQNTSLNKHSEIINNYFLKLNKYLKTTNYAPFTYYGNKQAKNIIVSMGSICGVIEETVADLNNEERKKYGYIKVNVYRPFLGAELIKILPKTVKKIAVITKNKQIGSPGEPLYMDVVAALNKSGFNTEKIINGRAGIGSFDVNPSDIKAVFDELNKPESRQDFTIGINDDITMLSLKANHDYETSFSKQNNNFLFIGIGGDGTVSSCRSVGKIIADMTQDYVNIAYKYNSLKATNVTFSILQTNKLQFKNYYFPKQFNFIVCTRDTIINRINVLKYAKNNSTILLNTSLSQQQISAILSNKYRKILADKNINLYLIDANKVATECGLAKEKISMIIQKAFFLINKKIVIAKDKIDKQIEQNIIAVLKKYNDKTLIEQNILAVNKVTTKSFVKIQIPSDWKNAYVVKQRQKKDKYDYVLDKMMNFEGEDLPVSAFIDNNGDFSKGFVANKNNTFDEKKKVSLQVPRWIAEKCIQCNKCAMACPHSTIRAFLVSEEEKANAPKEMETLFAVGAEGYEFCIQVDAENCVGCGICAEVCPVDALEMVPSNTQYEKNKELTNYLYKEVPAKELSFDQENYRGVAFRYPYFEASGACPGCGETPYIRLLTQLFGKDLVIANATGCSSIYGGDFVTPWAVDKDNEGPVWVNSLFEDNAEFGLGIILSEKYRVQKALSIVEQNINNVEPKLKIALQKFLKNNYQLPMKEQRQLRKQIIELVEKSKNNDIKVLLNLKDSLVKKAIWIIGGDSWAFDIDIGGIKHLISSGYNVNVLVLNTEVFSNTGGQSNSASPYILNEKQYQYAAKRTELGTMLLSHRNAYVAQVAFGMNPNQTIKAFIEASKFDGPAIIIAYCPCIYHGFDLVNQQLNQREAVLSGYWPIYRFNPANELLNKPSMELDFKFPNFELINGFLNKQNRYKKTGLSKPAGINNLAAFIQHLKNNFAVLKQYSN